MNFQIMNHQMKKHYKNNYKKKKIRIMSYMKKQNNYRKIINKKIMKVLMINMIKILNKSLNA